MAELRSKYALSTRGLTLAGLSKLAGLFGFSTRALRLEIDEISHLSLPCIIHWEMVHFVTLVSVKKNRVEIFDPALGMRTISKSELSDSFTGIALELTPNITFEANKPPAPLKWHQLTGKVKGLKSSLGRLLLLGASIQLLAMLSPMFTQWVVDGAIISNDKELLIVLALGAILMGISKIFMESARGWFAISLSTQFSVQWAMRMKNHLLKLPLKWFEVRHIGDINAKFQSIQSIQNTVTGKFIDVIFDGLFSIITLALMTVYSWKLTIVALVSAVIYSLLRIFPHKFYHKINDEIVSLDAKAQTYFIENIRGIQTIKLNNIEQLRGEIWQNSIIDSSNKKIYSQLMSLFFSSGYSTVFLIESTIILGFGALMAMDGEITVGMLMAYLAYKSDFSGRMQRLTDNIMSVRMLRLHVDRVADIALTTPENTGDISALNYDSDSIDNIPPKITLKNVGFRYSDDLPWVFRNINLVIEPGKHICFHGVTGCGKTTLAKVILGLLEPTEGEVLIEDTPILSFGIHRWREMVSAVMQDDQLLSASIKDNVSCFSSEIRVEKITKALRNAEMKDDLSLMPMGINTFIGEMGSNLSGGQRQRIMLARAFCKNPLVLVLDEATSHLDVKTEERISSTIKSLNITRITIAHRKETIASSDINIPFNELANEN